MPSAPPLNRRTAALVVAMILLLPSWPEAHEIPTDVTVQAFVKPEAGVLRLLVRAPLGAFRDYDFPRRGPGYLRISEAGPMVREAAEQWIGEYVVFEEAGSNVLMHDFMEHGKIEEAFKEADRNCSLCRQPGRCRRWLDWGQINDAPRMFCPNADLFLKIRADQENSRCTDLD